MNSVLIIIISTGTFTGPDIRKLLKSEKFCKLLSPFERDAFTNIKLVINGFLGNHRAENYKELIHNMMTSFDRMEINMSTKIHFLHQHLDFFKDNLGKISDEHGERFHQQIKLIEQRFLGKNDEHMMAEYVWKAFEEEECEREIIAYRLERSWSSIALRSDRLSLLGL